MIEQTVLMSLEARGRIEDLDELSLPSFLTFDQTMPPLVVALAVGAALSFFDVAWFTKRETVYWTLCAAYFVGLVVLEGRQRRIRIDVYRIYLAQFRDEDLQRVRDCPWTGAGISFQTKLAVGELLNWRRAQRTALSESPAGAATSRFEDDA